MKNIFEFLVISFLIVIIAIPMAILVIAGIFWILPIWGKIIFGFVLILPILFYLKIFYDEHLTEQFIIDTEFGKGKCKLIHTKETLSVFIYLRKTVQNFNIKRNFFNWFFEPKAKYSKLMVISGNEHSVLDVYNNMKKQKKYDYYLIEKKKLKTNIIDLYEKSSKININEANIAQLAQLPFMDKNKALKVLLYIQKNGELNSVWEFAKLAELEQNQIDSILKRVYVKKTEVKNIETYEDIKKELSDNQDRTLDIL